MKFPKKDSYWWIVEIVMGEQNNYAGMLFLYFYSISILVHHMKWMQDHNWSAWDYGVYIRDIPIHADIIKEDIMLFRSYQKTNGNFVLYLEEAEELIYHAGYCCNEDSTTVVAFSQHKGTNLW